MKIQAFKSPEVEAEPYEKNNMDIFITRFEEKTTYENGKRITEWVETKTNISKKINETAKIVKIDQSQEILDQVKAILG